MKSHFIFRLLLMFPLLLVLATSCSKENDPAPAPVIDSPLNGTWETSDGSIVFQGTADNFIFLTISSNAGGWYEALQKGFITAGTNGTAYIKLIQADSEGKWSCSSLWNKSSTTEGVKEVAYSSNSTITMSADKNSFVLKSESPWEPGTYGSRTLYRQ